MRSNDLPWGTACAAPAALTRFLPAWGEGWWWRDASRSQPVQYEPKSTLFHDRRFADEVFEWLVGLFGEICVQFPHLGCLGDKALVGGLRISGLDLDCFFERFGAEQFLQRRRAFLERPLGVVRSLGSNRLDPFRHVAPHPHRRVHMLFAIFLHVVEILQHRDLPERQPPHSPDRAPQPSSPYLCRTAQ